MINNEIECSTDNNIDSSRHKNKKEAKKNMNKLPKSAFALYVRLYCCRKETKSFKHTSKMIEATKSWITLSDFEKQKFYHKYKEYQQKYSDAFIACLQKSEPFMKRKASSGSQKNILNVIEDDKIESNATYSPDQETNDVVNKQSPETFGNHEDIEREQIERLCIEEDNNTLQEPSNIVYLEPIAPSIKSGKELFEIIQSTNAENIVTWTTLSQKERSLYNQAILTMKRDYIQKYKIYLETLSNKELFDHYNKCFK